MTAKILNTEEFIARAIEIHGETYDYSPTVYTLISKKLDIVCRVHGLFSQRAEYHLRGCGCLKCGQIRSAASHQESGDTFIRKAIKVHGDKFDYSKMVYKKAMEKVEIVCPIHGSFWQSPSDHLSRGCSKCSVEKRASTATRGASEFIRLARLVHGDYFDYSKVVYVASTKKVTITCPIHGDFDQEANSHLQGKGCRSCAVKKFADTIRYTEADFIRKAVAVHGDKYGYSDVTYVKSNVHVHIKCATHGEFLQTPAMHLSGRGCYKCADIKTSERQLSTTPQFIEKAMSVHDGKYQYPEVEYAGAKTRVKITCPEHGVFMQTPNSHLFGNGCAKCSGAQSSKVEKRVVEFLSSMVEVVPNVRNVIPPQELDCVIPSRNLGVEFCGVYYHSEKFKSSSYHADKLNSCLEKGIGLVQIFEDEWAFKNEIVKSILRGRVGVTSARVFARKTSVTEVSASEARTFLTKNHLQGYVHSEFRLGLQYNGELVMVAMFSNKRKVIGGLADNWFELTRLCTKLNTVVVGGFKKLLSRFISIASPSGIRSYCDLRYFSGSGYETVGFERVKVTKPGFYYTKGIYRVSRFKLQAHKLPTTLANFDPSLSAKENILANGYYRIFDCGNAVYEMRIGATQT